MAWGGGFVELLQHARHHHALVDDGPARERGEVDLLALGLLRVVVDDVSLGGAAHLVVSCSFMEFESRIDSLNCSGACNTAELENKRVRKQFATLRRSK